METHHQEDRWGLLNIDSPRRSPGELARRHLKRDVAFERGQNNRGNRGRTESGSSRHVDNSFTEMEVPECEKRGDERVGRGACDHQILHDDTPSMTQGRPANEPIRHASSILGQLFEIGPMLRDPATPQDVAIAIFGRG
jgi:hypothetical protein